jgi:hypothetical protein
MVISLNRVETWFQKKNQKIKNQKNYTPIINLVSDPLKKKY